MKWINAYMMFDGNCQEAMEFYQSSLGGDLQTTPFSEEQVPGSAGRTMHARLAQGGALLMASDSPPGDAPKVGNNVRMAIECESLEEMDRTFAAMGKGGTVTMPLADQFWGARFGMLTDKFGMNWMFNLDTPKS